MTDQRSAPLLEGIQRYKDAGITPYGTPGHKRGVGAEPELIEVLGMQFLDSDIPLGGGIDDTHFTGETLRVAEKLAAQAWNADKTFFLLNGSSAGNHAYLLATLRPDDEVVIARDIHKSMLVALILTGAKPIYVAPRLHPTLNVGMGVDPDDIEAALKKHPKAKMVALVSPSYCGVPSDLVRIAEIAHDRHIPVYVDEAWGPHFHFHPSFPPSAMDSGVDGAVTSTHKILASLSQAAILNVRGSLVDWARVKSTVAMVNTTSPSAPILASIDSSRRQMALHGRELLERTIQLAQDAKKRLQAIPGVDVLDQERLGSAHYDLTKLVVDVHELGLTGFEAEAILRSQYGVQPEMSDLVSIVALITVGDTQEAIDKLVNAIASIAKERHNHGLVHAGAALRSSGAVINPGKQAMSPREAFFAPIRAVTPREAIGQVAAELVIPYPPGIPVLAPGDIITAEKIDYLEQGARYGMYFSGPADTTLATIRIVDR